MCVELSRFRRQTIIHTRQKYNCICSNVEPGPESGTENNFQSAAAFVLVNLAIQFKAEHSKKMSPFAFDNINTLLTS